MTDRASIERKIQALTDILEANRNPEMVNKQSAKVEWSAKGAIEALRAELAKA